MRVGSHQRNAHEMLCFHTYYSHGERGKLAAWGYSISDVMGDAAPVTSRCRSGRRGLPSLMAESLGLLFEREVANQVPDTTGHLQFRRSKSQGRSRSRTGKRPLPSTGESQLSLSTGIALRVRRAKSTQRQVPTSRR